MADTIPNLWPEHFKVDVQTPYTILRVQAGLLGKVTRGILQGDVETETSPDQVQHRLVVVAPAFNSYRHTLIVVRHNPNLPYPAEVRAEALGENKEKRKSSGLPTLLPEYETVYPLANSDEQMLKLVQQALQSEPTQAVVLSLIAKSNEAQSGDSSPSPPRQGPVDTAETGGRPEADKT
jgi:hypothetical protein